MTEIPFELAEMSEYTQVTLQYVPSTYNEVGHYCCWGYQIHILGKGWLTEKEAQFGLFFPTPKKVFVVDPKDVIVHDVCPPNEDTYDYKLGREEPQVIVTKKNGKEKFQIHFVSWKGKPTKIKIVLCRNYRDKGWRRVDYDGQYEVMGPPPQ